MSGAESGTREFELKFDVSEAQLERLRNRPILRELGTATPRRKTLRSVYFDTPSRILRDRGISFRVRQIGDRWVQTLKANRDVIAGVSNPIEIETKVAGAEPDLEALEARALPGGVGRLPRNSELVPVFETLVLRTVNELATREGSRIEVAFDEGIVNTGRTQAEINEIEIELKSGDPACVFDIAGQLIGDEPLRFSTRSKADKGYAVVDGVGDQAPEPTNYQQPRLSPGASAEEALSLITRACLRHISHNWRVVLDCRDKEGPHQFRIGLRRLRSTLKGFGKLMSSPALRQIHAEARQLAAIAGELRDLDVLATEVVADVIRADGHDGDVMALSRVLDQRRRDVRSMAEAELGTARVVLFLLSLSRMVEAPPWSNRVDKREIHAADLARKALRRSWKEVKSWGRRIDDLSIEERHSLRKALKRLRYQFEAFEPLLDHEKSGTFVVRLRKLQNVFGYLNDVAMAERLTRMKFSDAGNTEQLERACRTVLDWHVKRYNKSWKKAKKIWSALNKSKKPWR